MLLDFEIEIIRDHATATLWQIEEDVIAGIPFEKAKADRIRQMLDATKSLSGRIRPALANVLWSLEPGDMSAKTSEALSMRFLHAIEEARGKPAGRIERFLYRVTGLVLWT